MPLLWHFKCQNWLLTFTKWTPGRGLADPGKSFASRPRRIKDPPYPFLQATGELCELQVYSKYVIRVNTFFSSIKVSDNQLKKDW